jgi:hypothetical protein
MQTIKTHSAQDESCARTTLHKMRKRCKPLISLTFLALHRIAQDKTPMIIMCAHTSRARNNRAAVASHRCNPVQALLLHNSHQPDATIKRSHA